VDLRAIMEDYDAPFKDMYQKQIDDFKKENKELKQSEQIATNKAQELSDRLEKLQASFNEMKREIQSSGSRNEKQLQQEREKNDDLERQLKQMSKQVEMSKESIDS